ncbi:SNF5-domain-containing protein [Aulographum hederae CBS 113979]|uniref:SNF5-domain-containing protein n=1 Tax=Aulographum hederae CBS 113979 TaxID=1176131 RepID=A0A6G1GJZ3_9PEZI|nr:SNF5-domain-containing protein [Aulographum hederae CBS 113979]
MASTMSAAPAPQAFISCYAPRIRQYGNSLLTPIVPPAANLPVPRTTKRGTTAINYAEDGYEDEEDSEGPRRHTGLRSRPQRDDSGVGKDSQLSQLGKETNAPVEVQGIWRGWMGAPKRQLTERQVEVQSALPLTLIPIRIDVDIQPFRPDPPLPAPQNARDFGIDETHAAYRPGDLTPAYRLKDAFLWNLHESLITPDQFARTFVDEVDFPIDRKSMLIKEIATQIRVQLEEYAGVALHPLFHTTTAETVKPADPARPALSRDQSSTPLHPSTPAFPGLTPATPTRSGVATPTPAPTRSIALNGTLPSDGTNKVTATAAPLPEEDIHNPDDTYRCILSLSINLMNRLYTDKFEWSLLHPSGLAEDFARITCADLGLAGEWVPTMTHAIYEAVLRLKKEACENGGLVIGGGGEIENDCAEGKEAGWRYENEGLGDEWEPKVEILSKEEIEKREGDRERQIRRLRRETARFSSTANMSGGMPQDIFSRGDSFYGNTNGPDQGEERMGRGERSKKKRRFRSLSPLGRDTPVEIVGANGYGGGAGQLSETERMHWRCAHCKVWGAAVWAVRDGPTGPRSLCPNCGLQFERDKQLPSNSRDLFANERSFYQR